MELVKLNADTVLAVPIVVGQWCELDPSLKAPCFQTLIVKRT